MSKKFTSTPIKRYAGRILILVSLLLIVGLVGSSCVQGLNPIGWSGGAVSDNTLFVGTEQGRLAAVDLTDESRQWAEVLKAASASGGLFSCMPMGGGCSGAASGVAIYGTPAVGGELVYIAGYNGKVYAYVKDSLALRWVYPRDTYLPPIVGGVAVSDSKVFFGCSSGKIDGENVSGAVFALDAVTGDPIWNSYYETEDKIWATPAVSEGTLYIGSFDKKVYAINTADGTLKWAEPFETEGAVTAEPLVVDGTVYIGSHDRYFYAINADNGKDKWKFRGENWFWAKPIIYQGKIYVGCLDGYVYVLDAATGAELKEFNLEGPLAAAPVLYEDNVIFSTRDAILYSINASQDEMRQLAVIDEGDARVYGPLAIHDGIVYIHTQDKTLRRVNAETGAILGLISLSSGE
jgi:outer membrane protein assembly factor BamB